MVGPCAARRKAPARAPPRSHRREAPVLVGFISSGLPKRKGRDLEQEVAELIELPSVFAGNNAFRNRIQDGELMQMKGRELVDWAKLNAQNQRKDGVISVQVTTDNHRASCSGYEIIVISDD